MARTTAPTHVDPETGVKGHFWTEPIEVTFDNWDYTPRQW